VRERRSDRTVNARVIGLVMKCRQKNLTYCRAVLRWTRISSERNALYTNGIFKLRRIPYNPPKFGKVWPTNG